MNCSTHNLSPAAALEIERHKYFLSEKAGYDVGWEFAAQDWMSNHAGSSDVATDSRDEAGTAQEGVPAAKGLGSILRRLLSKAGVL